MQFYYILQVDGGSIFFFFLVDVNFFLFLSSPIVYSSAVRDPSAACSTASRGITATTSTAEASHQST
jgi:hypothetical protein